MANTGFLGDLFREIAEGLGGAVTAASNPYCRGPMLRASFPNGWLVSYAGHDFSHGGSELAMFDSDGLWVPLSNLDDVRGWAVESDLREVLTAASEGRDLGLCGKHGGRHGKRPA